MDNQQLYGLTNQEIQLLLSLYFGDGCFIKQSLNGEYHVQTSCIHEDYLLYKQLLLTNLKGAEIVYRDNKGYNKKGMIYTWRISASPLISNFYLTSFEEKLNLLDELGIALWFYDDGSLHKTKLFYNLCTHSFTIEQQELILKKFLEFKIKGHLLKEVKKDGRIFYYISVNKYAGAIEISSLLEKVKIESLAYKLWSSTTSQEWRTFQEEWKSREDYSEESFIKALKYKTLSLALKGRKTNLKI